MKFNASLVWLIVLLPVLSSADLKQEARDSGWLVTADDFEGTLTLEWPGNPKSVDCYGEESFATSYLDSSVDKNLTLPITIYLSQSKGSGPSGLFRWKNNDDEIIESPLRCSPVLGDDEVACSLQVKSVAELQSLAATEYVRLETGVHYDFRSNNANGCRNVLDSINRMSAILSETKEESHD